MDFKTTIKDFFAGDTIQFEVTHESLLPSDGFNCRISFANSTDPKTTFLADNDLENNKYIVTLSNTDTESITAGTYRIFLRFFNNETTFVKNYEGDKVLVKPDISNLETYDDRSPAQKRLEALYALKDDRFVEGIQSFTFNGRSITFMTTTEIEKEIQTVKTEVERELRLNELQTKGYTNRNRLRIRYQGMKVN